MNIIDKALKRVETNEGVWSDDPVDRGGKTKYGVTEKLAKKYGYTNIKNLTRAQAKSIMVNEFWRFTDVQHEMIAIDLFDAAVNFGLGGATLCVQQAVNNLGFPVKVDGGFGPKTLSAINSAIKKDFHTFVSWWKFWCQDRYHDIIKNDPSQIRFYNGWTKRAQEVL